MYAYTRTHTRTYRRHTLIHTPTPSISLSISHRPLQPCPHRHAIFNFLQIPGTAVSASTGVAAAAGICAAIALRIVTGVE